MKRIVTIWGGILLVIGFFTGCSSLAGSMEVDANEIESSVVSSAGMDTADVHEIASKVPDYFKQNIEEKFQDMEVPRAFRIKDEHSQKPEDMEQFQVGALLEDKTFIYAYVTRMDQEEMPREIVHCGAFYNYQSEQFQVFHENHYKREWEGDAEQVIEDGGDTEESFYIQVCRSGEEGEIFVYDNGEAYLYHMDGQLKFHADVESFVRTQYPDAFSISVVHGVTDGENRLYLELSVENEAIDIPDSTEEESEETKEEEETNDLDQEIEELDQEMENKVESMILVYEFRSLNPLLYQENKAMNTQAEMWKNLVKDKVFDESQEPKASDDWLKILNEYPNQWGGAKIANMNYLPVYNWKGEPVFLKQGIMCTFIPDTTAYEDYTDLVEGQELWRHFIPQDSHFCQLYGRVGRIQYPIMEKLTRTITLSREEEKEDANGEKTTETKTWEIEQDLFVFSRQRYSNLENSYLESYWILGKDKALTLENGVGHNILCHGEDGKVYWIQSGGKLKECFQADENMQVRAYQDGDRVDYLLYNMEGMKIRQENGEMEQIDYAKMTGVRMPGTSVYDQSFQQSNEEQLPGGSNGYGGIYLTEENLVRAGLSINASVLTELKDLGEEVFEPSGQGYLITTLNNGILYYDTVRHQSLELMTGSWLGSWKLEDQIISVGFLKNASYGAMDVVFGGVYEYELNKLVNDSMEATKTELLEAKRKEEESASLQAEEDRTRESIDPEDTIEDLEEQWEKKHPKEEREKAASQALDALKKSESQEEN